MLLRVDSVRYGILGCFITNRIISKGEEILSDYGPRYAKIDEEDPAQSWYYESWQKFKEHHPDQKQKIDLYEAISRTTFPM